MCHKLTTNRVVFAQLVKVHTLPQTLVITNNVYTLTQKLRQALYISFAGDGGASVNDKQP